MVEEEEDGILPSSPLPQGPGALPAKQRVDHPTSSQGQEEGEEGKHKDGAGDSR